MTEETLLKRIETEIAATGSARAWAKKIGVPESQVSLVRARKIAPTPRLLVALGVRRVVTYLEGA